MIEPVEVISQFAKVGRPVMRRFMPAASCIASARTTIEVMNGYGLSAFEIPTCYSFEVPARKYARVGGFSVEEREEMRAHAATWRDDPGKDAGDYWNGHLIVLVEGRWLLDPSLDQVESEEFGVPGPNEIFVLDIEGQKFDPNAKFEIVLGLRLDSGDTATLTYRRIEDCTYLDTDAWRDEGLGLLACMIAENMETSKCPTT